MNSTVTQPLKCKLYDAAHNKLEQFFMNAVCWSYIYETSLVIQTANDQTKVHLVLCALILCMKKSDFLIAWFCFLDDFRLYHFILLCVERKRGKKSPFQTLNDENVIVKSVI